MGLGKTMQAIVAIRLLLHAREISQVLLVCPKPLVTNWTREFGLWAPEIPICVIEGSQAKRNWQWQATQWPVKIANYELMARDQEAINHVHSHYDLVVLDEAQRIKNSGSSTSQIIRSIARSRSWALTGTPVENSTDDIVGIFDFLSKGLLSPGMSPRQISHEVRDFILRRTKDNVMEQMPPKLIRDAELELSPEQFETYSNAEEDGIVRLNAMGHSITIQHVFELVLRLKQICNFDPATGKSSKMERLVADLDEVAASGQKAIVFSQWVKSLQQIGAGIQQHQPLEYHGGIPSSKRDAILKEFRENPARRVLLMSYGAGSVGLNLQFCRYVFLFDRWWNPAVEDQAINRAHRIGVKGSVTVSRMLTVGTIEERINQVLDEKRELFHSILGETASPRGGLSRDEVFGLFKLRVAKKPATPDAA
jgi:SNF2 family DNA or RNA helicase